MSNGGSIAAMVSSLKNNRLLLKRRSVKLRGRDAFMHLGEKTTERKELHHKKASKREMELIRKEIAKDQEDERRKTWIKYSIILFFAGVIIYLFYQYSGI